MQAHLQRDIQRKMPGLLTVKHTNVEVLTVTAGGTYMYHSASHNKVRPEILTVGFRDVTPYNLVQIESSFRKYLQL